MKMKCLAQGHNTAPLVRFEPLTSQSRVWHSTKLTVLPWLSHDKALNMSSVMGKPTFCICENKDADQLRSNREADQPLCFGYIDSTIPLLSKSEISSLYLPSVAEQPGLCRNRSKTRMLVFS